MWQDESIIQQITVCDFFRGHLTTNQFIWTFSFKCSLRKNNYAYFRGLRPQEERQPIELPTTSFQQ